MKHPAKIKILSMGRRWGKSVLGGCIALSAAANGAKVAWIAPTYKNTRPLWRTVENAVASVAKQGYAIIRRVERTVEFLNGGFLAIYSGDNPTSILGEWFHLVIIDEAARIPEFVWSDTIQPTLADASGDAILISTPKGKNWFYREWDQGQKELKKNPQTKKIASWIAPSSANPSPQIQQAALDAQVRVSSRTYKQEWKAEFIDDGGDVFRIPESTKTAIWQEKGIFGHTYVLGIDTAPKKDFNAICVVDCSIDQLCYFEQFNNTEITLVVARIIGLATRFNASVVMIEENGAHAIVQSLQRARLPVIPFKTTNASKSILVDKLALALETANLRIPNKQILIEQLESIEGTTLPGGSIRYAAPEGQNDDLFIACGLALHASENVDPNIVKCATFEITDNGIQIISGKDIDKVILFTDLRDIGFISFSDGYFSISRIWLDAQGNRHIVECLRRKTHASDALELIHKLHGKRPFESFGIDQKLFDSLENEINQSLDQHLSDANPLPLFPIELETDRAMRQQTAIQSGLMTQRITASSFIQRQGNVWSQILNMNSIEDDARDSIAGALILAEKSY